MDMMDNKVIGNKLGDNKQAGNRRTAESSTQMGKVGAHVGNTKLNVQNSREHTPNAEGQEGNSVQKKNTKQAKSLRTQNQYSDGAVGRALASRGM